MPYLNVKHVLKGDRYVLDTDLNEDGRIEVLETFLHGQMGQGVDNRKPEKRSSYLIRMKVDLSDDTFFVQDSCGNKGLRDGILMCLLNKLVDDPDSVKIKEKKDD